MKDSIQLIAQVILMAGGAWFAKNHISLTQADLEGALGGLATFLGIVWKFYHWFKTPANPALVSLPNAGAKAAGSAPLHLVLMFLVGLAALVPPMGRAQGAPSPAGTTTVPSGAIPSTPWGEIGQGVIQLGEGVIDAMPTNIAIAPYATVVLDAKDSTGKTSTKIGGGVLVAYNLSLGPIQGGPAVAVDYVNQFMAFNGGLSLSAPIHPFAFMGWTSFSFVPTTIDMVGTPLAGSGGSSSAIETATSGGAYLGFGHVFGGSFFAGGLYGTRSGAGAYSGNYLNLFAGWTKHF